MTTRTNHWSIAPCGCAHAWISTDMRQPLDVQRLGVWLREQRAKGNEITTTQGDVDHERLGLRCPKCRTTPTTGETP